jgi:hypothetical protein
MKASSLGQALRGGQREVHQSIWPPQGAQQLAGNDEGAGKCIRCIYLWLMHAAGHSMHAGRACQTGCDDAHGVQQGVDANILSDAKDAVLQVPGGRWQGVSLVDRWQGGQAEHHACEGHAVAVMLDAMKTMRCGQGGACARIAWMDGWMDGCGLFDAERLFQRLSGTDPHD